METENNELVSEEVEATATEETTETETPELEAQEPEEKAPGFRLSWLPGRGDHESRISRGNPGRNLARTRCG